MNATRFVRRFQCPSQLLHSRIAPAADQTERDPRDGLTLLFGEFA